MKTLASAIAIAALTLPSISMAEIPSNWTPAKATYYESYPTTEEECITYNGCQWEGQFAFVNGKQTKAWVASRKIASVYEAYGDEYAEEYLDVAFYDRDARGWRILRNIQVLDVASDSDCIGCGTSPGEHASGSFLIDLEVHTMRRLTGGELYTGPVFYRAALNPPGS